MTDMPTRSGARCASVSAAARSSSTVFRRARPCSTGCARRRAPRGPRRAAPKAIAAPAPSCWRACAAGELRYDAVNACILLLGQLDGAELITVEDSPTATTLHPVQQAMVDHARLAMRLLHAGLRDEPVRRLSSGDARDAAPSLCDQLAGNLCRCTGYRPILDAALATCDGAPDRPVRRRRPASAPRRSRRSPTDATSSSATRTRFFAAPASVDVARRALCALSPTRCWSPARPTSASGSPSSCATSSSIIWLGRVAGLDAIERGADGRSRIGAGATLADAAPLLAAIASRSRRTHAPLRLGAGARRAARSAATSPTARRSAISPPALIALGGASCCARARRRARLPLEDFFIAYGKQDRAPGEFVRRDRGAAAAAETSTTAPSRSRSASTRTFPPSCAAFALRRSTGGASPSARIAYGGMAATPKRAAQRRSGADRRESRRPPSLARRASPRSRSDFAPLDRHARHAPPIA